MRNALLSSSLLGALVVTLGAPSAIAAPARGRYYVVVRGVDEAKGISSGIGEEAKALFLDELKRHPELTLDPPPGLPTEPDAMVKELKRRKVRAFELTLKILEVDRALNPPPPGKQFQVLVRGIKLAVIGDTLPEKILAIGGDGEAQIGQEVGKEADLAKEGKSILLDCTKQAIKQAVDMTIAKLDLAAKPAHGHKRHHKKT